MSQPIILSAHDTLLKLLRDRSAMTDKWLEHVSADPLVHSIVQLPVPGKPLFSLYVLVDKDKLAEDGTVDRDYLAMCPSLLVQQSISVADPNPRYPSIRGMQAIRRLSRQ